MAVGRKAAPPTRATPPRPEAAEAEPPALWIVATPIGNLGDMTARAIEVLRGVDVIAAEDTRRTRQLLTHFDIPAPARFISYREENRERAADEVLAMLAEGRSVALVTDAGMPVVSDPGDLLVDRCHAGGFRVTCAPGPSAILSALACSGLPARRFTFEGFLSRRASHRKAHLDTLRDEPRTMIFLEAPSRIDETLAALRDALGPQRRACVARELTKKFEELRRGTLAELAEWSASCEMRGEMTIVVEGATPTLASDEAPDDDVLRAAVATRMADGLTRRQAAKEVAARHGLDSRAVYEL